MEYDIVDDYFMVDEGGTDTIKENTIVKEKPIVKEKLNIDYNTLFFILKIAIKLYPLMFYRDISMFMLITRILL